MIHKNIPKIFAVLTVFSPLLHAQVSHEGVIGAPFYGITSDSTLEVVNQVLLQHYLHLEYFGLVRVKI